jgi:hypothetical protein
VTSEVRMQDEGKLVLSGTWLYDNGIPCRVEIWQRTMRPGSGDHEDPPEVENDLEGEWYEVKFVPSVDGQMGEADGGYYATIQQAIDIIRVRTNYSIRWDP